MKEDNTFLLSKSTGWIIDWEHPAFEICQDKRRGSTYGKITYTVVKEIEERKGCVEWRMCEKSNKNGIIPPYPIKAMSSCFQIPHRKLAYFPAGILFLLFGINPMICRKPQI